MDKNKLIALFMGKCWHEFIQENPQVIPYCKHCNKSSMFPWVRNPDFSSPDAWHEFFVWLCKEREDVWGEFACWIEYQQHETYNLTMWEIVAFFVSDLSHFRDLFASFLCLPETIERWGWEPCFDGDNTTCYKKGCESWAGNCPGKLLTPWARYAKEG